jgi:hypothetical protein
MDTRRMPVLSVPGSLLELVNGHINRGGEIEKRLAFVPQLDLPANTFGLAAVGGTMYTFGSVASVSFPAGSPANLVYQQLTAPNGAALARDDPHGLDADEAGALTLYTFESELYRRLNDLLRQRDRQRLRPFFPYLKLMIDARRKLPRHVGTVWRGVKGVDLRSKYQKGSEVYWWAFSSTT